MKLNAPNALADCQPNAKPIMDDEDAINQRADLIFTDIRHKVECFPEMLATLEQVIFLHDDSSFDSVEQYYKLIDINIAKIRDIVTKAKGGKA